MNQPNAERGDWCAAEPVGMGVGMLDGVSCTASRMLVHMGMRVTNPGMAMRMHVEVPPAPAHQQPHREQCDQQANGRFGDPLNPIRQKSAKEHHRQPESEQRGGVA